MPEVNNSHLRLAVLCLGAALVTNCGGSPRTENIATQRSDTRTVANVETEFLDGSEVAAKQMLVKLERCDVDDQKKLVMGLADLVKERTLDDRVNAKQVGNFCWYLVTSSKLKTSELLQTFRADVSVKFSGDEEIKIVGPEPNYIIRVDREPNIQGAATSCDADLFEQGLLWGLQNLKRPGVDIDAQRAWKESTNSQDIAVGVVDTGIDCDHADLKANVWSAPEEFDIKLGTETIHCPKDSHGFNAAWINEDEQCKPLYQPAMSGHGTHVAGIIGAVGDNKVGVVGVNFRTTKLIGLQFISAFGSGSVANAVDAIEFGIQLRRKFGVKANLRVLNASWGFKTSSASQMLREELVRAKDNNIFVAASAGEDGKDNDSEAHYPSGFDLSNLVSVTAIDQDGLLAKLNNSNANVGQHSVHLAAPGTDIYSTWPTQTGLCYLPDSGTSMATPFVSGVAALLLSTPNCADLTADGLKSAILRGVVPTRTMTQTTSGGRLNAYLSITHCH